MTFQRLQELLYSARLTADKAVLDKLQIIMLRACETTGAVHAFRGGQRCVRCEKQLCFVSGIFVIILGESSAVVS